ncbi:MAG: hypothetical protein JO033_11205 [Acidobacteriaceae bacterium]|nr:hypothetical protein [Acidobacteriaceae bacterium]MBV9502730.1 hypothetical protein [Acidobacteriaceae bacterium]
MIEAAKVARWNPELAVVYEREKRNGNRNRGTLAVARKIVAYLLAVDPKRAGLRTESSHRAHVKGQMDNIEID